MKALFSGLLLVSLVAPAGAALAQVVVEGPGVTFAAAPPLEEVEPGIQVVPDQAEEVYYVGGWYWARHGGRWFRTRDWHGHWAVAGEREVPARIYRIPPGRYAHWHHGAVRRAEHREERREARHEWR